MGVLRWAAGIAVERVGLVAGRLLAKAFDTLIALAVTGVAAWIGLGLTVPLDEGETRVRAVLETPKEFFEAVNELRRIRIAVEGGIERLEGR